MVIYKYWIGRTRNFGINLFLIHMVKKFHNHKHELHPSKT